MELEERYRITDYPLLIKSFSVLVVIILLFFFSSIIPKVELELGEKQTDKQTDRHGEYEGRALS